MTQKELINIFICEAKLRITTLKIGDKFRFLSHKDFAIEWQKISDDIAIATDTIDKKMFGETNDYSFSPLQELLNKIGDGLDLLPKTFSIPDADTLHKLLPSAILRKCSSNYWTSTSLSDTNNTVLIVDELGRFCPALPNKSIGVRPILNIKILNELYRRT